MRQRFSPDRLALTGSLIGLASLFPGWLTLRPNRLASGVNFSVWNGLGAAEAAAIAVLWAFCLVVGLVWPPRARRDLCGVALGIAANLIIVIVIWSVGLGSGRLLQGESSIARVSLGGGFWAALAGAYTLVFAARRRLLGGGAWFHLVSWSGLAVAVVLLGAGWLGHLSVLQEYAGNRARFLQEALQHLRLFGSSVIVAAVLGVPLGVWATRNRYAERPVFFITNIVQTVPSLALFGLLIAPLSALSFAYPVLREFGIRGVGVAPAVIALTIYSLLPIVRNTYVGIRQVDPAAIDAGLGMGMGRRQILFKVEAPLAAPLVLEGVRTAAVQAVGLTTVAALIGAGGLGWFVFQGIGQAAPDLIILGAIPVIILALLVDGFMRAMVRLGTPAGVRREDS
jgi:osmoprotectant transport system permease protein